MSCSESSQTEADPLPPSDPDLALAWAVSVEPRVGWSLRAGPLVTFLVTFQGFTGQICGPYSVNVPTGNRTSRSIHPVPAESRRRGGRARGRKGAVEGGEHKPEGCAGLLRREGAWTHSRTNIVKSALLFHKLPHPLHQARTLAPFAPCFPAAAAQLGRPAALHPSHPAFAHPHFSFTFR